MQMSSRKQCGKVALGSTQATGKERKGMRQTEQQPWDLKETPH